MSQWNQLRLTLAVGVVLSIQLMWGVHEDAARCRPARRAHVALHRTLAEAHAKAQPRRA
jgi:hypothetical protein